MHIITARPGDIRVLERSMDDAELEGVFQKFQITEVRLFGDYLTEPMRNCVRLALKHRVPMHCLDPGVRDAVDHFVT